MSKPRLHLDSDASDAKLERELLKRGHDVTRTPNEWIDSSADDEEQLQKASAKGRALFTYNIRHFMPLAKSGIHHAGVIVSPRNPISRIFKALDRFFNESSAEEMEDQVRWLSDCEKD
jgi:hypothetical protein